MRHNRITIVVSTFVIVMHYLWGGPRCLFLKDALGKRQNCANLAPSVRSLLAWLPTDTETLVVNQRPMALEDIEAMREKRSMGNFLEWWSSGGFLFSIQNGVHTKHLKNARISMVIEGARSFRRPAKFGLMRYQGCHILSFKDDLGDEGVAFLSALNAHATDIRQIAGQAVLVLTESYNADTWTLFITQPQPNVLIFATDEGYICEVIRRSRGINEQRAFPENISEWSNVDIRAPIWAIRHYNKEDKTEDPSSPFFDGPSAFRIPDHHAIGITMSIYPSKRVAQVFYLSDNQYAKGIASSLCSIARNVQPVPSARTNVKGIHSVRLLLERDGDRETFIMSLLAALGHGILF